MVEKRLLLRDNASALQITFKKRIWTWLKTRNSNISSGANVIVDRQAELRLTNNAQLILGDYCAIDAQVLILLTKPEPKVTIGAYVSIGRGTIIAAKKSIEIGAYTRIAPYCTIHDQEHGYKKDELIMNQTSTIKPVKIGQDCWLGGGVRVLMGVTIGDGAVIGAGSVVNSDIPPYQIWAGVPARFIKNRD